jgi:hypothetical protein
MRSLLANHGPTLLSGEHTDVLFPIPRVRAFPRMMRYYERVVKRTFDNSPQPARFSE